MNDKADLSQPVLAVNHLGFAYGRTANTIRVIDNISFAVERNQIVSLVGPSGCGKTTLLRCIAGLMQPTFGEVLLDGVQIKGVPTGLAMVFQDYSRSLYPWMSINKNIEFPLTASGLARPERLERVRTCLEAVGLDGHGGKFPWQLSGGMQQRASIARAIAYQPEILLMDEPFASVDAQTRADLEDLVLGIRRNFKMTILFVTHDIDESVYLSDKVVVLSKSPTGVQDQVAVTLREDREQIYTRSEKEFSLLRSHIAGLIRSANPGII